MPQRTMQRFRHLGLLVLLCAVAGTPALAQVNFRPLERGDYTEVEQRVITIRGLEAHLDYALRLEQNDWKHLPPEDRGTELYQDARLHLKTVFHNDVFFNLVLEPSSRSFKDSDLRERSPDSGDGRLRDSQPSNVGVREAYLRYEFNPNSGWIAGKHELSLGDRRGKVFDALVPAITFDCDVGTWCMPFGVAYIGPRTGDNLYHWELQYNAWDTKTAEGLPDALQVAVYRIIYNEANVPLGENLGPYEYNPDDPTNSSGGALPGQLTQPTGEPIYYDARKQDYYGLRMNWDAGGFFLWFDFAANRGSRDYHLYRDPQTGIVGDLGSTGIDRANRTISGLAYETELGWRWNTGRLGLRYMTASGDEYKDPATSASYLRGLDGYYEITPGGYRGTRLYFNGSDAEVGWGSGLGHSINNTRLLGFFLDYDDKDNRRLGYSLGLYKLDLNNGIPDVDGKYRTDIGIELDNMLIWYVHKALNFQFEANLIDPAGAFRLNDYETPGNEGNLFVQGIVRMVYQF